MLRKRTTNRKGFTIVELAVATMFLGIVALGAGIVVADSQRGWILMYDRIYSEVVTDGHIARRTFDSVVRKASRSKILLGEMGAWLEVRYYQDPSSITLDRYARFYLHGSELKVEYGRLEPREVLSTHTVCANVSCCVFTAEGAAVQMVLKLDDGSSSAMVISAAIAHH
ncbi:MAG: type II secretion system protein [Planctomycetota bacterium]